MKTQNRTGFFFARVLDRVKVIVEELLDLHGLILCRTELLITAGGENVAPVPIEDLLKEELPVVSNCMLIGDKKKFLAMLITMKVK